MILTLFDQGKARELVLPDKVTGKYILTTTLPAGKEADLMAVEAEDGKWYLKSNNYAFLIGDNGEKVGKLLLEHYKTYTILRANKAAALLYAEPPTEDRNEYTKHIAVTNLLRIGRSEDNQICFANKLVSGLHCVIQYDADGHATLKDCNSSNGTYVNGRRVEEKQLAIGDVISIMGLKIIYNGTLLSLNNPQASILLDRHAFQPFQVEQPVIQHEDELDDFSIEEPKDHLFYRSPRFKKDIKEAVIKIDPPPQRPNMDETPLMLLLGPSITMGMASLFMGIFAVQNAMMNNGNIINALPMLMMSISMLLGTVLWPILTKRHEKKQRIKNEGIRQEKYRKYLVEMKQVIDDESVHQSEILHENHITLTQCLARIKNRERNLWERSLVHNDFLKLRLGLGNVPLDADIKFPEKKFSIEDDNLQEELYELVGGPQILEKVPVTISLLEEQISGFIGDRKRVTDFVKGLIFQMTALHSYDELKLIFIYDGSEKESWEFVKWLPHVWDDGKQIRFIATNQNELKELSAYFEKEITRQSMLSDEDLKELNQHYVVFSMNKKLASKAEMTNLILKEKKDIGFSLVTLYDELQNLPKECSKVVELGEERSKIYDKDDISGTYTAFQADIYLKESAEIYAIKLANTQLATEVSDYTLPDMLTFLEMFGVSKIEHLNIPTRWKENNPTLTIQTPIGVDTTGEIFNLDLHEKYHGPHGLIAGMTGSGKSEFIMTFILSLAVNYHPDEVAFILIDYKGGGMANAFLDLPHLAGTITNLDGAAVKRSLISIQSELKRRQAIFSETSRRVDESNIDIYKYQKLYREGIVTEPLQHLFMISDEFAELKTQQPEFMDQLVSAARIGRSLGVHLILATQKPSGVVDDQIWSNSKFRISLKVQEKADSMEVIKRPDAAELTNVGRFFLQVGYNEIFELGQSAWAGAPYYPTDKIEKKKDESISIIDSLGRVIKSAKIDRNKGIKNPPKQLDEITDYLASLAKQENIKVKQLWLEPIPPQIFVEDIKIKYSDLINEAYVLNPFIGEFDDPSNQRQLPLRLPITQEGNTVVYGVTGSGKTSFLQAMLISVMEEHTPEEVNFYLLDFSTETLNWFRSAPHVGDVVVSHEAEKIQNLMKLLQAEIVNRKKLFANYGGDVNVYNRVSPDKVPSIVVVIHNYSAFSETYEDHEETIAYLTREGTKYGIYFIVTATNTGSIRYRLLQNFKQLFVLQLNDQTEYSGVLGNVDGVYPSKHKGRGIFKSDHVYEFQIAKPAKDTDDLFSFIEGYSKTARETWNKEPAPCIPTLPERVTAEYIQNQMVFGSSHPFIPVGVDRQSLKLSFFDFQECFVNLVSASQNDAATPFMQGLSELLSVKAGDEVIVLDPNGAFRMETASNYRYASAKPELETTIVHLFETLVHRNNTKKDAEEQGHVLPEFHHIYCVLDSFSDLSLSLSEDTLDKLKVFLERGANLNVHIIMSDSADKFSSVSFEEWFKKHASVKNAIWIGSGISDQYLFKIAKITTEMYQEIPNDFGYVIKNGKVSLVKLLTSETVKEEVAVFG